MSPQGACAAVLLATTLYASHALAGRCFPAHERCARWTAACIVGIGTAIAVFEALAPLSLFRIGPALGVAVVGALAVRLFTRSPVSHVAALLSADLVALGRFVLGDVPRWRALRAGVALLTCNVAARALILPPIAHDSVTYHATRAAMWVQSGGSLPLRMPGGWAVYRSYPPGGEILGAWAMLPFHADTLYLLVDVALWLAWIPALAGLCNELELAAKLRAPLVLYVLTIPGIYFFLPSGYVDVTVHTLALATLFFSVRALHGREPAASAALAAGAGVIAVTVKIPAMTLPAVAGVVLIAGAVARRTAMRGAILGLVIGSSLGLLALAPILIRNTLELGVPLGFVPVRVLGLVLGELRPEQVWYFDPEGEHWGMSSELLQLGTMLGLQDLNRPTFGPLAIPLLALLPFGLFVQLRRDRFVAALLALTLGTALATYCSPSFALLRNHYGWCNARLFMLLPTITALLAPALLRANVATRGLAMVFTVASIVSVLRYLSFFPSLVELLPLLAWNAIGGALALIWLARPAAVPARLIAPAAIALLAAALVLGTPGLERVRAVVRYPALMHSLVGHRFPIEWTEFARLADQPDQPHRVAIVSGPLKVGARQLIYFFLGSKLQNELVYVSPRRDGTLPVYDRPHPDTTGTDEDVWIQRMLTSGSEYIAVLNPPWIETPWLAERPEMFQLLAANQASLLFRARRPSAAH